jgi:hypothetical protein
VSTTRVNTDFVLPSVHKIKKEPSMKPTLLSRNAGLKNRMVSNLKNGSVHGKTFAGALIFLA